MARVWKGACSCIAAALVVGCSIDRPVSPEHSQLSPAAARVDSLARFVALAMRDAEVRRGVRDVLRESKLVEHKILFREFLATPQGQALIRTAARKAHRTVSSITALLDGTPELEFYMPGTEFRRAWRGEANIVVAAAMAEDRSRVRGYYSDGRNAEIYNGPGYQKMLRPATLYLTPAEQQYVRIDAPSERAALRVQQAGEAAIEDASETGWGAAYRKWKGSTFTDVQLVRNLAGQIVPSTLDEGGGCDPEVALDGCGGEGGGGGGSPVAYLAFVNINEVCDFGDCGQNNEFEWHTYSWSNTGGWVARLDVHLSLPSTGNFDFGTSIVSNLYPPSVTGTKLQSDIVETDPDWVSGDDHFNPSPQWTLSRNNVMVYAGDLHCYMGRYDPITGNCYDYKPEVGTIMRW